MPALTSSVGDMIDALERVAGKEAIELIKMEKDDFINGMIGTFQFNFDAKRANSLGFEGDTSFDEIIKAYIEDELGGSVHIAKKQKNVD